MSRIATEKKIEKTFDVMSSCSTMINNNIIPSGGVIHNKRAMFISNKICSYSLKIRTERI